MAPFALLLSALALAASVEGTSYGRGYGYLAGRRRRVFVKAIPVKRVPYSHKSAVFRSPYDSYDEADALRTADHDVHLRVAHKPVYTPVHTPVHTAVHTPVNEPVHTPVHKTVFVPPYPPAVVEKTAHVPLHAGHDEHVVHDVAHVIHEHAPYQYDPHVVPGCALVNQLAYNVTICLDDAAYPTDTIIHELKKNHEVTDKLMSDVTYQSADNLVDGLTKAEEENYNRQHYYGVAETGDHLTHTDGHVYASTYQEAGGYICPSDIFYGRLKRAVNTFGEWKVIVNLPDNFRHDPKYKKYVQTSRLESCVYPGSACSFVDRLFPSACLQKYTFVRLVAYSYERGLHVDSFKLPSACSCHVSPKPALY